MRTPCPFDGMAVDGFRARPAFGRAEDDHGPARAFLALVFAARPRGALDLANAGQDGVERRGEALMNQCRIVAFDEMRLVAVAAHQLGQFLPADARQHRRIGDLEAVEVQDRQDRPVARGIEELVRMPARGQRAGFRLAVADDAGDDQVGIVERRAVGMGEGIAELASFVDRARNVRRYVAGNAVGPGELPEEPMQSGPAAFDRRIVLGVRSLQVGMRHQPRPAVPGADDIDHVEIVLLDQPVEVDIEEVQSRRRAPMSQQPRLDMVDRQRRFEQRVILQIDLPHREIVRRSPVGVHLPEEIGRQAIVHALSPGFVRVEPG